MQPFANVLQNWCFYKFLKIYKKMSVLESLCNKATGLMAFNFIKKEAPSQVFSSEYHKMFDNSFFMEHFWWLLVKMVEIFVQKNL